MLSNPVIRLCLLPSFPQLERASLFTLQFEVPESQLTDSNVLEFVNLIHILFSAEISLLLHFGFYVHKNLVWMFDLKTSIFQFFLHIAIHP